MAPCRCGWSACGFACAARPPPTPTTRMPPSCARRASPRPCTAMAPPTTTSSTLRGTAAVCPRRPSPPTSHWRRTMPRALSSCHSKPPVNTPPSTMDPHTPRTWSDSPSCPWCEQGAHPPTLLSLLTLANPCVPPLQMHEAAVTHAWGIASLQSPYAGSATALVLLSHSISCCPVDLCKRSHSGTTTQQPDRGFQVRLLCDTSAKHPPLQGLSLCCGTSRDSSGNLRVSWEGTGRLPTEAIQLNKLPPCRVARSTILCSSSLNLHSSS